MRCSEPSCPCRTYTLYISAEESVRINLALFVLVEKGQASGSMMATYLCRHMLGRAVCGKHIPEGVFSFGPYGPSAVTLMTLTSAAKAA